MIDVGFGFDYLVFVGLDWLLISLFLCVGSYFLLPIGLWVLEFCLFTVDIVLLGLVLDCCLLGFCLLACCLDCFVVIGGWIYFAVCFC